MEKKGLSTLIVFKVICCAALLLFAFGGLGLLSGLSTGNSILIVLGLGLLGWGGYIYYRKRRRRSSRNGEP